MNERHIVDASAKRGDWLAEPLSAVAMLAPPERGLHDFVGRGLEQLDRLAGIKFLAVTFNKRRLVIKRIALARGAGHVELNDALRLCRTM
jgi:hypothetical protein